MSADPTLLEARQVTQRVARTFAIACRLLPKPIRDDVYLLYLVFRTLDDLVDHRHPEALERIRGVEAWCDGELPTSREGQLLGQLDRRHALPRHAMRDFCAGMRQDLAPTTFADEDAVDLYCYRVAGTVGLLMTALLGTRDGGVRSSRAAVALGMAMQRTNILRDIDEDYGNGRIYLAQTTLERFGGSLEPGCREYLLRNQIARADRLYDEGLAGIGLLSSGRRAVAAAAVMYREILRQIEREGYGSRAGRAIVGGRRKLAVAAPAYAMPPS